MRITNTLQVIQPDIKRYEDVAKQFKSKIRERRTLLEEKKSTPAIQVFRHRELAHKIEVLTEDIEDLKSEKTLLLNQFDCADDHGMAEVKQRGVLGCGKAETSEFFEKSEVIVPAKTPF